MTYDTIIEQNFAFREELDRLYALGNATGFEQHQVDELLGPALDAVNATPDKTWRDAILTVRRHLTSR